MNDNEITSDRCQIAVGAVSSHNAIFSDRATRLELYDPWTTHKLNHPLKVNCPSQLMAQRPMGPYARDLEQREPRRSKLELLC